MPGDDLKKVARGAPLRIPAAAYNSFIDAAADYRNRALGNESALAPHDTRPGIILVRNKSGSDQDQFAILGLADTYRVDTDMLEMFDADGTRILQYQRAAG